ncbi:antitoxin [Streptomyces sp. MUM 203J]|uniref:antitoxin n=1 Tax=Streptomyces sp. MUM 203J TaxID=2791990 RepID=UPI001F046832|nr:antitoxin [Streptomyces sp. MUM 203J]MCH0540933.1 antitoxin [Streptomyces sp. MUM 203J]
MGILDTLKTKLAPAKDKVSDFAHQHGDQFEHGIDRAARMVDRTTKGRYSDKIESGTGKAKHAYDRFSHRTDGGGADDAAPPEPPPTA